MDRQRKVLITITYNETGIIIDTKAEEVAQTNLQLACNQLATDCISRQAAIDIMFNFHEGHGRRYAVIDLEEFNALPSAQPEPQWIPCKKQMPEPDSWAIWCSKKGLIQVARWKEDAIDHFWPDQGFFQLEDAVAWMSLPEPYREEECDEPDK